MKYTTLFILLLLVVPLVTAEELTVNHNNKDYKVISYANTATDPRRGFDPVESEQLRNSLKNGITNLAEQNLPTVARWQTEISTEKVDTSTFGLIKYALFGSADEAKVAARNNLRDKAQRMLQNARVNVYIGPDKKASERETQQDVQEPLYVIISGYNVQEVGLGYLKDPTATLTIPDYATFNQLTDGTLDVREAMKNGKISVSGSGIVNRWRASVFGWFSKYS